MLSIPIRLEATKKIDSYIRLYAGRVYAVLILNKSYFMRNAIYRIVYAICESRASLPE